MNKLFVPIIIGVVLSLMLTATVNASTPVSFFACNQGVWNQATGSGNLQINICTGSNGSQQGNVVYQIMVNGASVASGGCNIGPCSDPTEGAIQDNSFIILRFSPSYIYGFQVIQLDTNGNPQQTWVAYQNSSQPNCNPYSQFCFSQQSQSYCGTYQSNSCSAVVFRIASTPITINVFFTSP